LKKKTDRCPGFPDRKDDVINRFGTYNIQPTADTGNPFPMIAQGLARTEKERLESIAEKKNFPVDKREDSR